MKRVKKMPEPLQLPDERRDNGDERPNDINSFAEVSDQIRSNQSYTPPVVKHI